MAMFVNVIAFTLTMVSASPANESFITVAATSAFTRGAYDVLSIGKPGVPTLSEPERRRVTAVLAAAPPAERSSLMFALISIFGCKERKIVFFYRPAPLPLNVKGERPPKLLGDCGAYYRDGEVFAGSNDVTEMQCKTWKPSAADIAAGHVVPLCRRSSAGRPQRYF